VLLTAYVPGACNCPSTKNIRKFGAREIVKTVLAPSTTPVGISYVGVENTSPPDEVAATEPGFCGAGIRFGVAGMVKNGCWITYDPDVMSNNPGAVPPEG
jgi:hypothetical protein